MAELARHEPTFEYTFQPGFAPGGTPGSRRPGASAVASRPAVRPGPPSCRSGAPIGSVEAECYDLAPCLGRGGRARSPADGTSRAAAASHREGAQGCPAGLAQRPRRIRLEHRALDAAASCGRDRDRDWHPVPHGPRLEGSTAAGMELAEAGSAGNRARRRGDRALGARGVARDKNSPAGSRRGSSSRTKAEPR